MTVTMDSVGNEPIFEFCCQRAETAWYADAVVIIPEPRDEHDPYVFTAALAYEGGPALKISFCPFCGAPVRSTEPVLLSR